MSKIKSVSTYVQQDESSGYWSAPTPLGANIENIDITSAVYDAENDTMDTVDSIQSPAFAVSATPTSGSPDTGASAWTKFNIFRKRVGNILSRIENKINRLNSITWTFNGEWQLAFYGVATNNVYIELPCPPLATNVQNNLTDIKLYIPGHQGEGRPDNYHTISPSYISISQPLHGKIMIVIPVGSIYGTDSTRFQTISTTPGHLVTLLQGSITFS